MTKIEQVQAIRALQAWFQSQEINPADAGIMMISLTAELLVYKTKDISELAEAIRLHSEFLSVEVAGELRKG